MSVLVAELYRRSRAAGLFAVIRALASAASQKPRERIAEAQIGIVEGGAKQMARPPSLAYQLRSMVGRPEADGADETR